MATNGVVAERKTSSLIPAEEMKAIIVLDETLQAGRREIAEAEASGSVMLKGLMLARVTQRLRTLITPKMMGDIMALKNTPLGFKTDEKTRKGGPYDMDTVRDVVIVGLIDGARMTGNEMNILAGNYYRTKERFERWVREWPGLTQFRYQLAVPTMGNGGALVAGWASWKLDGVADRIDCANKDGFDLRIPVRVNDGMGADAILGKATRKLLARVIARVSGTTVDEREPDELPPQADGDQVIDASYTIDGQVVDQNDPPQESSESSPVVQYEQRFLEAQTLEAADEIMVAAATAGLSDEDVATAKAWHYEALKRIAAEGMPNEDAPPLEEQPLAGVWSALQKCELKKDAGAIYLEASKRPGLRDEDHEMLKAWLGQTKQRIYDSRGPRAGKQKQMEGVQ